MIDGLPAAPVVAAVDAAAIRFAPPIGTAHAYRMVRIDPATGGECRIEMAEQLRFVRTPTGYVAAVVLDHVAVMAEPRLKASLEALFAPVTGMAASLALDADGRVGAIIDGEASAGALRRSTAALLARIEGNPAIPADVKAMQRAMLARDVTPAGLDSRLREMVTDLLPPPLPPLRPGETRAFVSDLATPGGNVPATGRVTRADDTGRIAHVAVVLEGSAAASDAAAARLLAQARTLSGGARTRLEGIAAVMTGSRYVERTAIDLDRETGLVVRMRVDRLVAGADGGERSMGSREITRL